MVNTQTPLALPLTSHSLNASLSLSGFLFRGIQVIPLPDRQQNIDTQSPLYTLGAGEANGYLASYLEPTPFGKCRVLLQYQLKSSHGRHEYQYQSLLK